MGHETVSRSLTRQTAALLGLGLAAAIPTYAQSSSDQVAVTGVRPWKGLSATGFVDMSFTYTDPDGAPTSKGAGLDQAEIDLMYEGPAGVSAEIDLEYGTWTGEPEHTFVEQAFVTKKFNDQFSMKAGRFLSYSGWETEEPTGLFQYSGTGYAKYFYGFYQQGVSAYFDGGMFDVMASVVSSAFDPLDKDTGDLGYEFGLAFTPIEGFTAKAFYIKDDDTDTDIINVWASYAFGGFTLAAEYNTADYAGGADGDGYLLMANYATGPWSFTARYHSYDIEDGAGISVDKASAITLSPSYKVGENLLIVAEARADNVKTGPDVKSFALEALFTF